MYMYMYYHGAIMSLHGTMYTHRVHVVHKLVDIFVCSLSRALVYARAAGGSVPECACGPAPGY